MPQRLRAVLAVVYLVFSEGHTASSGDRLVRHDLCLEAIRLGRLLVELMPAEPEAAGLLALMLLVESRRAARTTPDGGLILLANQDRELWDRDLVAEGQAIVGHCLRRNQPGPYQIQAAIQAVHSDATSADATDWRQILQLYDHLMTLAPSSIVALHRAVAVAEVEGLDTALALVDALDLGQYHLFHAVRADLLRRLGRAADAMLAYDAAIARATNGAEQDFLRRMRSRLEVDSFTTSRCSAAPSALPGTGPSGVGVGVAVADRGRGLDALADGSSSLRVVSQIDPRHHRAAPGVFTFFWMVR